MVADIVVSYLLAIPACLLVEMPASALIKVFSKSGKVYVTCKLFFKTSCL